MVPLAKVGYNNAWSLSLKGTKLDCKQLIARRSNFQVHPNALVVQGKRANRASFTGTYTFEISTPHHDFLFSNEDHCFRLELTRHSANYYKRLDHTTVPPLAATEPWFIPMQQQYLTRTVAS